MLSPIDQPFRCTVATFLTSEIPYKLQVKTLSSSQTMQEISFCSHHLDLAVECWHHLRDQQLERRQVWKPTDGQHEVIDAEIDELLHLLSHLSSSADEGSLSTVVVGVELFHGSFCLPADTATIPRAAHRCWIALHFGTGSFKLFHIRTIRVDACPGDVPPVGVAGGYAQHARLECTNHNRGKRVWLGFAPGIDDMVVLPMDCCPFIVPHGPDDL